MLSIPVVRVYLKAVSYDHDPMGYDQMAQAGALMHPISVWGVVPILQVEKQKIPELRLNTGLLSHPLSQDEC